MVIKLPPKEAALIESLEKINAKFFFKVATPTMVSDANIKGPFAFQMEFPIEFIQKHGFGEDCNLNYPVRLEVPNSDKEWALEITSRMMVGIKRIFAYGEGGWSDFVKDNKVAVDDFVVFLLVAFSRFEVHIKPLSKKRRPSKWRLAEMEEAHKEEARKDRKRRRTSLAEMEEAHKEEARKEEARKDRKSRQTSLAEMEEACKNRKPRRKCRAPTNRRLVRED